MPTIDTRGLIIDVARRLFAQQGIKLQAADAGRIPGWLRLREWLGEFPTPEGGSAPGVRIFETCTELIRCLPALQIDKRRPSDCATEPHDITHAPDALRGFAIFHTRPAAVESKKRLVSWTRDMWEDFGAASDEEKKYLKQKYGEPK